MKRGKKYVAAKQLLEGKEAFAVSEAMKLLTETSTTKFDASCEVHVRLGVDPKHADQQVRATVSLPHGTGKDVKIIAFVGDDKVKECTAAGAIKAGNEDLIAEIEKGFLEFDIAVATPDMMKNIGKIAKILGQKGLMPNPKAGTVTPNPVEVINELKKGRVEFRTDKLANLHNTFGKVSFGADKLEENFKEYIKAVKAAKPSGAKSTYMRNISVSTAMGPGIKLDLAEVGE